MSAEVDAYVAKVTDDLRPVAERLRAIVALGFDFDQGRALSDPDGLLEGGGKQMAHVKLHRLDDIDEPRLRSWLGGRAAGRR